VKHAARRLFDPAKLTFVVAGSLGDTAQSGNHVPAAAAAAPQKSQRR